MITMYILIN